VLSVNFNEQGGWTMPSDTKDFKLITAIRNEARRITKSPLDYDPLMALVGDARFVLLGEASHGTHEFYRERAQITKRLIEEKGFTAVAVEADWPDAYNVNRYVHNIGKDTALEALAGFERFPSWMWANRDVLEFVEWLRQYNDERTSEAPKTGFYGLDVYSLYRSIEAVIAYLEKVDPPAAKRAHYRYSCFEHFGEEPQLYGYAARFNLSKSCEKEVVEQLLELQQHAAEYITRDGRLAEDDFFYAEQNARVIKDAEQYYRAMFEGRNLSWNLRDTHMADTLEALIRYLDTKQNTSTKIVVWAHNSHIGDARATEVGETGELNIGQLVREKYPEEAVLIGFTTYGGTVTAASNWDAPEERKQIKPALEGSYEALFHETGIPHFLLPLKDESEAVKGLRTPYLERAIGVIYHPHTERISHYFFARLSEQFDAVIHIDGTSAVIPIEPSEHWEAGEIPETYPTGL
jgi:erythromycin esterase-like protein